MTIKKEICEIKVDLHVPYLNISISLLQPHHLQQGHWDPPETLPLTLVEKNFSDYHRILAKKETHKQETHTYFIQ